MTTLAPMIPAPVFPSMPPADADEATIAAWADAEALAAVDRVASALGVERVVEIELAGKDREAFDKSVGDLSTQAAAIKAAHEHDMRVIALTGRGGGQIGEMLRDDDIHLCVPAERTARIQETHLLVIHCLCDGIDALLLGVE